jgi:transposase
MQVYIGIDWSENKHDVAFMNQAGAVIADLTIEHTPDGFLELDATRAKLDISSATCLVGLETAHNLIIDFLWSRQYEQVYVIPPSMIKGSRSRFGSSGARTDATDARLIADVLRTDRGRLQPWHPDSLLTRQIRAQVSLIGYLTRNVVRTSNRLRAVLLRYYPAALCVFSTLRTQVALQFIRAYPTPQAAAELTFEQFQSFAQEQDYRHTAHLRSYYVQLQGPHPQAMPETVVVYQNEAVQLATLLLSLVQDKNKALRDLSQLFAQHPDAFIFASLPGTAQLLAPALLAKFGDHRDRFPSPASVQALAGTCPVTDSSGKRKVIYFRKACDRDFRNITQQWAKASLSSSLWAVSYWKQVRPRCSSDSHAYRCLANRWLSIAWTLWQRPQAYDEAYHMQQRAQHSKPRA